MRKHIIVLFLSLLCIGLLGDFSVVYATQTSEELSETSEMTNEDQTDVVTDGAMSNTEIGIQSPSVVLMELNSGHIIYEKDGNTARKPASVTKLMTMLLSFEALESGRITWDQVVTVSEHASSMGGSQVYLEPGEEQTIETLMKSMIVSSANDAAVAMAEVVAGSETAFVQLMNDKAKALGMNNTSFQNACGLDAEGHVMSAKDIAILSRQLLLEHPEVTDYTTIWMDTIIHRTKKGESEFGLANTNKFLKKYDGANGLKTGYTSEAGFSMSATATRNGMTLIAVVMGSETKDIRYADATTLLDYGFANCYTYEDHKVLDGNNQFMIDHGENANIKVKAKEEFSYVFVNTAQGVSVDKEIQIVKNTAPVKEGEVVAKMNYFVNGERIGSVDILAIESVEERKWKSTLMDLFYRFINIG